MARKSDKSPKKGKQASTTPKGFVALGLSIVSLLSLLSFAYGHPGGHNLIGMVGFITGKWLHALLGIGSYFVLIYASWISWRWLFNKPIHHPIIKTLYALALTVSSCILLSLLEDQFPSFAKQLQTLAYPNQHKAHYHLGGALFYYLYRDLPAANLLGIFNTTGVFIIASLTFLSCLFYFCKSTPAQMLENIIFWWNSRKSSGQEQESSLARFVKLCIPSTTASGTQKNNNAELLAIQPEVNLTTRPSLSKKEKVDRKNLIISDNSIKKESVSKRSTVLNKPLNGYKLPPPSLLSNPKKVDQSSLKQDLKRQAEVLEETLLSFGIEAKVGQINCGPTITSFEVHPSIGVKVQKIRTLENDIALNMEAKSIRIIAPIPGKAAVGIEVPNPHPQEVSFKEMLLAYQQGNRKFHVPILLGKAVNGDHVMSDLTKMPHCIIAGATGSGKSVCINTIVMSIVMNASPEEIKLIMVDPKKVELTPYGKLPHMLAPVITEPQGACAALNWLVKEMERRYEILKQLGVRNIDAFNSRTVNREFEKSLDLEIPEHLAYIVVIIDELADLMMVASNDIETPIARIAQMARAVGIHLILATQRPSREVITGLIKANFPTRISFKVASRVNSQIVLDEVGAETLLGNGDMLFLPPGTSSLVRAQGAFVRDEDIAAVIKQICDQAPPNYVIASFDELGKEEGNLSGESPNNDSLYDQAEKIVIETRNASTTLLQRKLKIGYARAASLIDELEANGVVGPSEGNKSRKIVQ